MYSLGHFHIIPPRDDHVKRRDATAELPLPSPKHLFIPAYQLSSLYKRNECRRKKQIFLIKNWLPWFVYTLCSSFILVILPQSLIFRVLSPFLFSPASFCFHHLSLTQVKEIPGSSVIFNIIFTTFSGIVLPIRE